MGFTTLQNTPVEIDLLIQGNSVGWSIDNGDAVHEACNAGSIYLTGGTIAIGETWQFSYTIVSISGSYVQAFMGTTAGAQRTSALFYTETLVVAGNNPQFYFYAPSATVCRVRLFNIQKVSQSVSLKQNNTIVWSEKNNKWSSFHTYNSDCGFSLFTNLYTYKAGSMWAHKASLPTRNNLYGVQYETILQLTSSSVENKTFQSISYEGNTLMITTSDGIETSLGQISELAALDYLKDVLTEGVDTLNIYSYEGVFATSFLRDKNSPDGLINGDVLKGSYITVELITVDAGVLKLKNVNVHSSASRIGSR